MIFALYIYMYIYVHALSFLLVYIFIGKGGGEINFGSSLRRHFVVISFVSLQCKTSH